MFCCCAVWGQTNQVKETTGPKPIATLEVGDRTYSDVTLRSAEGDNVSINHSAGIKTIPLIDLTFDQIKELNATTTRAQIDLTKVDPNPPSRDVIKSVGEWITLAGGVNRKLDDGNTPLIRAVLTGRLDHVKAVLYRKPDLNAANAAGNTAWKEAMLHGFADIAAHLEKVGAKIPDAFGAVQKGETDTLGLFLVKDPTGESFRNDAGQTLLIAAVLAGQTNVVQWLLEKGTSPETPDKMSKPPLLHAVEAGKPDIAVMLMEKGAKVNVRDSGGTTPLIVAAQRGSTNLVTLLLDRGARLQSTDRTGKNALMHAAEKGETDAAKLLLERGAKPDDIDREGNTAASIALARGKTDLAAILKEAEQHFEKGRQEKSKSIKRVLGEELAAHGEEEIKHGTLPRYLPFILWTGLGIAVVGHFWLVIMGFHESVKWGMGMFFFGPVAGFFFYRSRSLAAVWPLMIFIVGFLMVALPALLFQLNLIEYFLRR